MARPTRAGDRRQPGGNARHRLDGDNRVFLAAVTGVFVADVQEDGTFGKREPTDPLQADIEGAKQGTTVAARPGISGRSRRSATATQLPLQVFALDIAELGLPPGVTREEVLKSMGRHVLAEGRDCRHLCPAAVRSRRGVVARAR